VAATGGSFTRGVLEETARINARPIVFALSNLTSKAASTAAVQGAGLASISRLRCFA
jgi:hypothetical protein